MGAVLRGRSPSPGLTVTGVRVQVTCTSCGDTWPEYAYDQAHIAKDRRCSRWIPGEGYCGGSLTYEPPKREEVCPS